MRAAFWLFWLTFVSMQHNHNQLNTDGCFGAAMQYKQILQQHQQQQQQQLDETHYQEIPAVEDMLEMSEVLKRQGEQQPQQQQQQMNANNKIATINSSLLADDELLQHAPPQQKQWQPPLNVPQHSTQTVAPTAAAIVPMEIVGSNASAGTGTLLPLNDAMQNSAQATTAAATTASNKEKARNARDIKNANNSLKANNIAMDLREAIAQRFANDAPTQQYQQQHNVTIVNNAGGTMAATTAPPATAATATPTTAHAAAHFTGRRHITPEKLQYTKELIIKQGHLMGIVRNFPAATGLHDVEQYLGLPYAEAPVGSRRFMPPGAALPWPGLKIARHLPPVCPQKLPDLSTAQSSSRMSRGRFKHLTRLLPYLKVESEDCLYLNVYVPKLPAGYEQLHPYPVIVYLHGESFEWNSGNPYDGSVLASYGEVIVVTVNYRLGALGFMKPGLSDNTIANFGLLDQIAALHWIKENIHSFGGDKDSVTLMGHTTGAACVNYLMVSPVASGLFHRAILMSGSAMSDWAASNHSLHLTMQTAHTLNCPLNDDNDEMLECLRQKRYQDILKIPITFPQFSTSFGPIVDGHVIPNQPYKAMGQYTEYFGRYDLLFGITESEAYHTLGALALDEGLRENERDNLLRFYMQSRYDVRPDLALAATLKKYNDMYNNPIKATNLEHRDVVLDILSDARVVGPLIQTGLFHADVNRRNFMYVFGHNSAAGPHASLPHSIAGEELAFIFGAPLAPAGPFANSYSAQEKLLSEAVMAYWTNFAKSGNPKAPWRGTFINLHALEWDRYDLDWPEFNKRGQAYLNIGIPPSIGYKYRQIYMNFWNKELPDELNQIAAIQQQPFLLANTYEQPALSTQLPRTGTAQHYATQQRGSDAAVTGHMSKYGTRDNGAEDPVRTLKLLLQEPYGKAMPVETADNMYNAPPTFGISKHQSADDDYQRGNTMATSTQHMQTAATAPIYGITSLGEHASTNGQERGANEKPNVAQDSPPPVAKSETTLQLLIGLIVVFIVLNVVIYSTFLLQKRKKANTMNRKLGGILSYDGATDDELKRSKHTATQMGDGDESYILDMVRKSNTYEAVKTERSPINGYKITRQLSSSTVDTHTKVSEWMSAVVAERKMANGTLNRMHSMPKAKRDSISPTFSSLHGHSTGSAGGGGGGGSFATKPTQKVSVAIDATPQARGNSVLRQEPIEVTKLKGDGRQQIIICQEVEVADNELLTPQNSLDTSHYTLMRQDSNATEPSDALLPQHQHSRSDPIDIIYYRRAEDVDEQVTSFMYADCNDTAMGNRMPDINVTSRDDAEDVATAMLTPAEQLNIIKRRKYPKVLPTHSTRATDSPPMTADLSLTYKRNSLPPNSFLPWQMLGGSRQQCAPMPPPRTISTLGRKTSVGRRNSNNITTSPLMLAHDCVEDEDAVEPEITENTLIVGPIVPKQKFAASAGNEGNYSTLARRTKEIAVNEMENCNNACTTAAPANGTGNGTGSIVCACGGHAAHASANDSINLANDKCKQNRRPMPLPLAPPTVCLNHHQLAGSFQSFECLPPPHPTANADAQSTAHAHHTEMVYAVQGAAATANRTPTTALSPLGYSSAPTTPSTQPATTPLWDNYAVDVGKKLIDKVASVCGAIENVTAAHCADIYAQPNKMAIKANAAAGKMSAIPRILPNANSGIAHMPQAPTTATTTTVNRNCNNEMTNGKQTTDTNLNSAPAATTTTTTTTTAAVTTAATSSRIPQLQRNHSGLSLKSSSAVMALCEPEPLATPAATATAGQSFAADKPTVITTPSPTAALSDAIVNANTATTKTSLCNTTTATSLTNTTTDSATTTTSSSHTSRNSSASSNSTASTMSTSSSGTASSSSSSSTGTVRTELLQQK